LNLIRNLPPDSAFVRKTMNAPLGWDNITELSAQTVDLLHALIRLTANVNSERANTDELPRVPRPFEVKPEPKQASLNDLSAFLNKE
jgi:hypothetical protein